MAGALSAVDWIEIVAWLVFLTAIGLVVARRPGQTEDYFLAGRGSSWWAIGLAIFASNMSPCALVALAGGGYGFGTSIYDYEWTAAPVLAFFCLFLLPYLLQSGVYTLPEYLERRYDRRARLYLALMTLGLNVFVDSSGLLYSGALVVRALAPALPLWLAAGSLAGAAALYTSLGGLRAVIRTQAAQAFMLFVGATVVAVAAFSSVGGWGPLVASVDPAKLSLLRPASDPNLPWPGLLLGIPLLGFYYWCTNQFVVQRMLSARTVQDGRLAALFTGLLKLPGLFLMVLPGVCGLVLLPHLAQPDLVYPTLLMTLLPAGLLGLVVAAVMGASMVAVASTLSTAATLVTMDVVRPHWPALDERSLVMIGRLATAAFLAATFLWAPQLVRFPSLWQYLQAVLSYAVPPIVALFAVGMFWHGATARGAAWMLALGTTAGILLFLSNGVFGWTRLHFLYAAPILTLFDVGVLVAASAWGPPMVKDVDGLLWTPGFFRAETRELAGVAPWRNHRILALGLVLLTAGIVVAFR
jgi:SSS family solute:Na+ symporter